MDFFLPRFLPPEWVCRAMNEPMNELALSHSSNTQYVSASPVSASVPWQRSPLETDHLPPWRLVRPVPVSTSSIGFSLTCSAREKEHFSSRPVVINTCALKTF
jgi:hypothetical protein